MDNAPRSKTFCILVPFILVTLSLVIGLLLCEGILRIISPGDAPANPAAAMRSYTSEELDSTKPLFTQQTGSDRIIACNGGMNFHPHYGFFSKKLKDPSAVPISSGERLVVFMGGSVMANAGCPNHLTTIDRYVMDELPGWVSVNLAESGSRSSNELVRFVLETVDFKPHAVVFLDGYNEFSSIRYGGLPKNDFYWTGGVDSRIHRPFNFLFDKLVSHSRMMRLLLLQTGLVRSPRGPQNQPSSEAVREAARYYADNTAKILAIAKAQGIQVHFFLQPTIYSKKHLTIREQQIIDFWDSVLPGGKQVLEEGYAECLKSARVPVTNLRGVIEDTEEDVYTDEVHVNKFGNQAIARAIAASIKESYDH